jgi:PAS domain S-box-containing protein
LYRQPVSCIDVAKEESVLASHPQGDGWLAENGPQELEQLFRAIIFHPSSPILLTDNDRHYLEASVGASNFLGLPREEIIGRTLDDFAEPGFKPVISERWLAFLEEGEQQGTLQLVGPDGRPMEVEYSAKGNVLPVRHLLVLRDKTPNTAGGGPVEMDNGLPQRSLLSAKSIPDHYTAVAGSLGGYTRTRPALHQEVCRKNESDD